MNRLGNYFYTLKDLKFVQIWFRVFYIIKRKLISVFRTKVDKYYQKIGEKKIAYKFLDNYPVVRRKYYNAKISDIFRNKFFFLNREIDFGSKIDWNGEELNSGTRLWKLNLHYHEYLIELAYTYLDNNDKRILDFIVATIRDWDTNNPIGLKDFYKDNWNSYSISVRVISWIKLIHILHESLDRKIIDYLVSLVLKNVYFLKDNIEYDILGNHIIKNWKALYTAGVFLQRTDLKKLSKKVMEKYVLCQFSEEGMHEELSPMYAGIVLEDLMEVYAISKDQRLKEISEKLLFCVQKLTDFDRNYLFFNDSVQNNGVQLSDLKNMAKRLYVRVDIEDDNYSSFDGFYVRRSDNEIFVFDAGDLVLGHQPGHAHCDALSFEYCYNGGKVFTNSGVYEYNNTEKRWYCRSTQAHNTVVIGKTDQSDMWGSFRVAKKAQVSCEVITKTKNEMKLVGKVKNRISIHTREITVRDRRIDILDKIESNKVDEYKIYLHLNPEYCYALKDDVIEIMDVSHNVVGQIICDNAKESKKQVTITPYYPEFGKEMTNETLVIVKKFKRMGQNKISIRMGKI